MPSSSASRRLAMPLRAALAGLAHTSLGSATCGTFVGRPPDAAPSRPAVEAAVAAGELTLVAQTRFEPGARPSTTFDGATPDHRRLHVGIAEALHAARTFLLQPHAPS